MNTASESPRSLLGIITVLSTVVGLVAGIIALILNFDQLKQRFWPTKPPPPPARTTISRVESLQAAIDDLKEVDAPVAVQRRYLSLVHLHNNSSIPLEEIDEVRRMLVDLGGYLSTPGHDVVFRAVDTERTLFAFDLDRLTTEVDDFWTYVLRNNPYALNRTEHRDDRLAAAVKRIEERTGTPVAVVRGDWFIQAIGQWPTTVSGRRPPTGPLPAGLREFAGRYGSQSLDLAAAARDLGLKDEGPLREVLTREKHFLQADWGLAPLTEGKSITRSTWETRRFTHSPFQELSLELDLGTPYRP